MIELPESVAKYLPKPGASGDWLKKAWDALSALPGGKVLYAKLVSVAIPYTGSIDALVEQLEPGFAKVTMKDKRAVRNHLDSVHAIALCNLAELTGNAALAYSMPPDARFIVTALSIEYLKKARGKITATCSCPIPKTNERSEYDVEVQLFNEEQVKVAAASMKTLVGPVPSQ